MNDNSFDLIHVGLYFYFKIVDECVNEIVIIRWVSEIRRKGWKSQRCYPVVFSNVIR